MNEMWQKKSEKMDKKKDHDEISVREYIVTIIILHSQVHI